MKWLKSKPLMLLLLIASLCLSLAGSAYAFSDVGKDPEKASIEQLEKMGVISGDGKGKFAPGKAMNVASAVTLIVKGLDLNIDNLRFIKAPEASDYFTQVPNKAWYAQAFVIAHLNGLDLPKNMDPKANATREQFTYWLYKAILTKGEYAWIQMYMTFNDEKSVNPAYMEAVQRLLISKIAKLDAKENFRPKAAISRSEAAGMVHRAIQFVANTQPIPPVNPETTVLSDIKLTTEKVSDDLLKVTVSAMAPHPGYGIDISSIRFIGDQAIVNYRLILPDPAAFYPQVITEVKASAYVSSKYKPVLGEQEPAETALTKHPIRNPDGTSGGTGTTDGSPSGK
ncbi:S-layer homology domain-containing protein [Cohnella pontilimi]|nr:S-layer homology domain-containing protein [Cohnella pontilimi]